MASRLAYSIYLISEGSARYIPRLNRPRHRHGSERETEELGTDQCARPRELSTTPFDGQSSSTSLHDTASSTSPDELASPTPLSEHAWFKSLPKPTSISSPTFYDLLADPSLLWDPDYRFPAHVVDRFIRESDQQSRIDLNFYVWAYELVWGSLFVHPSNPSVRPVLKYYNCFDVRALHVEGAEQDSPNSFTKFIRGLDSGE